MDSNQHNSHAPTGSFATLMLSAIGVVYGDVGTSPLYTMKEVFTGGHGLELTPDNVLGILSLIFWALVFVISIKYATFVMRANNRGEGGIMALMALALRQRNQYKQRNIIIALGLFGTALFTGESVITPAISVLSAVEGLQLVTPVFQPYIIPITLVVLIGLFLFQSHGTAKVGLLFGPIMILWFSVLGLLGGFSIQQNPQVLEALNPAYGFNFFMNHGRHGFVTLGAVVLALTGVEALYADMGHFGKKPITSAWFSFVFPALVLNYFGQGALILRDHQAVQNPFYMLVPTWGMYPMIALATAATVIASQAVISGAFSIASQAMQMDYIPRMQRVHTSTETIGQIYVPGINWALLLLVMLTVLGFRSSSNLAAAYGIAVTGTMIMTTILVSIVALDSWRWPPLRVGIMAATFLSVDGAFFGANVLKIPNGGWFPLLMGIILFFIMYTWRRGREVLTYHLQKAAISLTGFIANLPKPPELIRVPGTAIYMSSRNLSMPHALRLNYEHNHVLHERVILVTISTTDFPYVQANERIEIDALEQNFYRVTSRYGFMETPNVPELIDLCRLKKLNIDIDSSSFFIGRETLIPSPKPDLNPFQEKLFLAMVKNASSAIQFFQVPAERVLEIGAQFEI